MIFCEFIGIRQTRSGTLLVCPVFNKCSIIKLMSNCWQKLKRPFFTLAPMYDVSDEPFRQMFVGYGKPDVLYTEFVSADGLVSELGGKKVSRELYFKENEHPIVAQIFGANPETIERASNIIADLGFDGIEINMGCPDRTVIKQGAGSALIKNPDLAIKIVEAAKRGAGKIPVSVKTRLGYYKPDEMKEWLPKILSVKPAVLTVHLRTMKDMSKVPARWNLIDEIVTMAKEAGVPIVANGDVKNIEEAKEKAERHHLDGVMIGRGVFGNPWFFTDRDSVSKEEKLKALVEQTKMFEELYGDTETNKKLFDGHAKNFDVMKKHYRAYVKGFRGALELRTRLMKCKSAAEVEKIIEDYLAG